MDIFLARTAWKSIANGQNVHELVRKVIEQYPIGAFFLTLAIFHFLAAGGIIFFGFNS